MEIIWRVVIVFILMANTCSSASMATQRSDIVSLAFCDSSLSPEDKMSKGSVEKVHTYAELKHDPSGSLPEAFTICSAFLVPRCSSYSQPSLFALLDNNRNQLFAPIDEPRSIKSVLMIWYFQGSSDIAEGKIPPIFPNQWTKSCLSLNTTSGLFQ